MHSIGGWMPPEIFESLAENKILVPPRIKHPFIHPIA